MIVEVALGSWTRYLVDKQCATASLVVVLPIGPVMPIGGFSPQFSDSGGEGLECDESVVNGEQVLGIGIARELIFADYGSSRAAARAARTNRDRRGARLLRQRRDCRVGRCANRWNMLGMPRLGRSRRRRQ